MNDIDITRAALLVWIDRASDDQLSRLAVQARAIDRWDETHEARADSRDAYEAGVAAERRSEG